MCACVRAVRSAKIGNCSSNITAGIHAEYQYAKAAAAILSSSFV